MKSQKMPMRLQKHINRNKKLRPIHHISEIEPPIYPYHDLHLDYSNISHYHSFKNVLIYGVYFICCIGRYHSIVEEQMETIMQSGLLDKTNTLFCFICQFKEDIMEILRPYQSKLTIVSTTENLYERFALTNILSYITTSLPFYIYYFHSKGVTREGEIFHTTRRNLDFFILKKYDACVFWLDHGYDAVGASLSLYPSLHFSGNFWWVTSDHLKRLPSEIRKTYYASEMYVCSIPDKKYISVCQSTNEKKTQEYEMLTLEDILKQSTVTPLNNLICKRMHF